MATKILSAIYQIIFLLVMLVFFVNSSPVIPAANIFTNETSIMMPDNETVIEMKIAVKNKDNSALTSVSKILLSPAVMDQIIGQTQLTYLEQKNVSTYNTRLVVLGHSLTACNATPPAKIKMAARGPQNGQWGMERCLPLCFCALPLTFAKQVF